MHTGGNMPTTDWSHLFVGREAELEFLKGCYEEAAQGTTRIVSLVAESGFGKTRLIQEFYNWLSIQHDGIGGDGYWPDRLLKKENNLLVNPESGECGLGEGRMPFLWWGLRLPDPTARNEIVAGALWAGLDILKPHLGLYSKSIQKENLVRNVQGTLASGAMDLALDAVGNLVTFGLLSTGKTLLEKGKELYDLHRAGSDLDQQDCRPHAAQQRANDELSETILTDLYRLAKRPPKGLSPIPLVIILDDAQWLGRDPGMASFASALVARARAEKWPLLIVMSSWEKEWRESSRRGIVPGSLLNLEGGDGVLHLSRTPGLEEIVAVALPGLPGEQQLAIIDQVDGNPRFLEEILLYLLRNRKYFVDRAPSGPLTSSGLKQVASMSFPEFVADRFAQATEHVRRALAIASTHGVAFSPRMVKFMAEHLDIADATVGLTEGDDPHGFATLELEQGTGEFRMRAYRNAAADDLANHLDEDEVLEALAAARAMVLADLAQASERDLALVFEADLESVALKAAAELIRRADERHDPRTAAEIAQSAFSRFSDIGETADLSVICTLFYAHLTWNGPKRHVVELLRIAVDRARSVVADRPSDRHRQQLAAGLDRLGPVVEALEGPAAARPLREENMALCRSLAGEQTTPKAQRDLAYALVLLGDVVEVLEGPAAARPLREESMALCRALVEEQGTTEHRGNLTAALSRLGDVVEALEGPAAARPLREENMALCHTLAKEYGSPGALYNLASALVALGDVVEALEGPTAARPLFENAQFFAPGYEPDAPIARSVTALILGRLGSVVQALEGPAAARSLLEQKMALCRALAKEQNTPGARRDLLVALFGLSNLVEALEGPAAARPLREEGMALCRALAEEQNTLEARGNLAFALASLGDVVEALEGPAAARLLHEEGVALCRALAEEQNTLKARRDLALALASLGNVVEALEGPAAARPLREEGVALCRALAEEQDTLEARRDLVRALFRLGNVVEALEGAAAARPLREEGVALRRAVAEEQDTLEARRDLALALARLGNVVEALEGAAAARPLREEVVALCRTLAEELGAPKHRGDLADALIRLGDVVEATEGPAAARPLHEEAIALWFEQLEQFEQ